MTLKTEIGSRNYCSVFEFLFYLNAGRTKVATRDTIYTSKRNDNFAWSFARVQVSAPCSSEGII